MEGQDFTGCHEPIAIVGIGCRFPGGVDGPEALWRLLGDGVDTISEVPPSRFDLAAVFDPQPGTPGKISSRHGGFLDAIDGFDAAFFNISPREAACMDPQQRLLLEVGWEALEDAGIPQQGLRRGSAGVFIGMMANEYEDLMYLDPGSLELHSLNGGGRYGASGRVSFGLGLEGPSLTVDTACSSSLVAVHLACQSLASGECDLAIAGGAHLILHPNVSICLSQADVLARDGRCKFGDARADGFVRGEGIGLVALERSSQALAAGRRIHALILATAVNSDGNSNGAMATPSRSTQEQMLRRAYRRAGVSPGEVAYVEAHGTGTSVGDRVELEALGTVLAEGRPPGRPCRVGSLKSNFGHTEGASGIAGLIKLALCLRHGTIPRSLHFESPNASIPWDRLPLIVQREATPWPREGRLAVGGVNSFGLSGTNAHAVLAAAWPQAALAEDEEAHLVPLSARSPAALAAMARSWIDWLAGGDQEQGIAGVARAAALRRTHHDCRLTVVAGSREELRRRLEAFLAGEPGAGTAVGQRDPQGARRTAFVFSGQGSQWVGMGRQLLRREPAFRETMERCAEAIGGEVDWSLFGQLSGEDPPRLDEIDVIQPALFAIQVALAALWRSWGVEPEAVVGHSMGEVAAAHVAGALSLEDAARVICRRSRLLRRVSGQGAMALVELPIDQAAAAIAGCGDRLSIAVSNSRSSTVLSGDPEALREVVDRLEGEGTFCRHIKVDVASHSPQMEALRADLLAALDGFQPRAGSIPIYSTVTGEVSDGMGCGPEYWVRNLRQPVLFAAAVERLLRDGFTSFVEVSPHPLLLPSIELAFRDSGQLGHALLSLRRDEGEREALLASLGELYALGQPVSWDRLHPGWQAKGWARLPTYPWQRERFWLPAAIARPAGGVGPGTGHPLLGAHRALAAPAGTHVWETVLGAASPAWLLDHRVHGTVVLPGAAYVEMALAAAAQALGEGSWRISNLVFESALTWPAAGSTRLQALLSEEESSSASLSFFSRQEEEAGWIRHAAASVRPGGTPGEPVAVAQVRARCREVSPSEHYDALSRRGLRHGAGFQGVEALWRGDGEALGRLALPPRLAQDREDRGYRLHPALLDSGFQLVLSALSGELGASSDLYLPVELRELAFFPGSACAWGHARLSSVEPDAIEGDLLLLDEDGRIAVEARGLRLRRSPRDVRAALAACCYQVGWEPAAALPPRRAAGPPSPQPGLWLLFADAGSAARTLQAQLEGQGERVVVVSPGACYSRVGPQHLEIDPASAEDVRRLLAEVGGTAAVRAVVHLWSLDPWSLDEPAAGEISPAAFAVSRERGCGNVLLVVQALARREAGSSPRLWLVTDRAQPAGGEVAPLQAPLLGLARVIAAEHPELGCKRVDVDAREAPWQALFREIWLGGAEDEVALRGAARLAPRLERLDLPGPQQLPPPAAPVAGGAELFRSDGTYLITGGLGGLGLSIGRWMATHGARCLALAGRGEPSPEARRAIAGIEELGARVVAVRADVACERALAAALAALAAGLPPLRGVIHAAGLLDDGILLELSPGRLASVMAPKVEGAWNLHRLTVREPLDFFVLFSSAASLLGTRGQGNYAAANAFLDALAHHRRGLGLPAVAVNWGAWGEIGLAAREGRGERLAARGLGSLSPELGQTALGLLLAGGAPQAQVAVMTVDWPLWAKHEPAERGSSLLAHLAGAPAADAKAAEADASLRDPARRDSDPAAFQRRLEAYLCREVAGVLRLAAAQLDAACLLTQLGLDSLMALELRGRIDARLGVTVPVSRLLKGMSFGQLVEQVSGSLAAVPAAASPPPPPPPPQGGAWEEVEL